MAITSLVISILALLTAGASALYSRHQADATKAMAKNDAERRLEERRPVLELEVEAVNNGGWHRLWLRLIDHGPLTKATVEILDRDLWFTRGIDGVDRDPALGGRVAHTGPLAIGEETAWRIEWDGHNIGTPKTVRLKVTCRGSGAGDVWEMTKAVDVPQPAPPVLSTWDRLRGA